MKISDYIDGKQPETIVYKEIDDRKLNLLVVKPENWSEGDKRTAIV